MKKQFIRSCGPISTTAWKDDTLLGRAVGVDVVGDDHGRRWLRVTGTGVAFCDKEISPERSSDLAHASDEAAQAFRECGIRTCLNR